MIPRIQTGTSFAGAGLYYLHDKKREGERERLTDERVAWTYAINTMEEEPEAVLAAHGRPKAASAPRRAASSSARNSN
jgi:hypothetical protein